MTPDDATYKAPGSVLGIGAGKRLTLHLGVFVQPYRTPGRTRGRKPRRIRAITTADVAGWLENRYRIMETYFKVHGDNVIAPAIENSLEGSLESILMGSPPSGNPFASGMQRIEVDFRRFISSKEAEGVGIRGTPTKAALLGLNPRLKSGRGPRRPSFRATGLYMNSFRAWID